jgi:serpin B
LQTAKDYYDADIYKAALNNQTCKDVNNWVNKKTEKMIPKILDRFSENAVMCLVNALAFDAEWDNIYEENSVSDGEFIKEDGTKQDASFMESTENLYLEDDKAKGFMKYYAGGKYAFVAMLPNNGVSISEYISSLNSDSLNTLLLNPQSTDVYTEIPKFETEYKVEMSKILKTMGIPKAFDKINAEFDALGTSTTGNIYIDEVLHKTYISVGEKGTRAAAATNVIADDFFYDMDIKEVCLNRPFVYMLIDCENNIPFFIGTMMDVKN